jgi:hypothetical protein
MAETDTVLLTHTHRHTHTHTHTHKWAEIIPLQSTFSEFFRYQFHWIRIEIRC